MGFAGLDRSGYPGDAIMKIIRETTNLKWCGYYLAQAPAHKDPSWMGKRKVLTELGYGIAPLYLGEQTEGPGSRHPSAEKGTTDGKDAVRKMADEGFPPGSCVYLDLENGPPLPDSLRDYMNAWCSAVRDNGFLPGVYCTHARR